MVGFLSLQAGLVGEGNPRYELHDSVIDCFIRLRRRTTSMHYPHPSQSLPAATTLPRGFTRCYKVIQNNVSKRLGYPSVWFEPGNHNVDAIYALVCTSHHPSIVFTVPARFHTEVGPLVGIVASGHVLFQREPGYRPLGLVACIYVRATFHIPGVYTYLIASLGASRAFEMMALRFTRRRGRYLLSCSYQIGTTRSGRLTVA